MSSRPAWSTRASSRTGTKNYGETLSQKIQKKKQQQKTKQNKKTSNAGPQRRQASKVNTLLIPAMCIDHTAYAGNPRGQRHTVIELRYGLLLNPIPDLSPPFCAVLLYF